MDASAHTFVVFTTLGLVSSIALLVVTALAPAARSNHTATMILLVAAADAIFVAKFWITSVLWVAGYQQPMRSFRVLDDACAVSSTLEHFAGSASSLWNAAFSFDFFCVLWNPLRSTRSQMRWYHLAIWPGVVATTLYVAATPMRSAADPVLCFLRSPDTLLDLLMVYPVYAGWVCGFGSILFALVRLLCQGTRAARAARCRLFGRHLAYTSIFMINWLWIILALTGTFTTADAAIALSKMEAVMAGGGTFFLCTVRLLELWWLGAAAQAGTNAVAGWRAARARCSRCYSRQAATTPHDATAAVPLLPADGGCGDGDSGGGSGCRIVEEGHGGDDALAQVAHPRVEIQAESTVSRFGWQLPREGSLLSNGPPLAGAAIASSGLDDASTASRGTTGSRNVSAASRLRALARAGRGVGAAGLPGVPEDASGRVSLGGAATLPLDIEADAASAAGLARRAAGVWDFSSSLRAEASMVLLSSLCQAVLLAEAPAIYAEAARLRLETRGPVAPQLRATPGGGGRAFDLRAALAATGDGEEAPPQRRSMRAWISRARVYTVYPVEEISIGEYLRTVVNDLWRRDRAGRMGDTPPPPATPTAAAPDVVSVPARSSGVIDAVRLVAFEEATFAALRAAGGVPAHHVVQVLDPLLLRNNYLTAHFSDGASSSFFCRALDASLVVKTVSAAEVGELLRLLPAYARHLLRYPDSLLCRFYGCYMLSMPSLPSLYYVLMANVDPIHEPARGTLKYDLKGSWLGRAAQAKPGGGSPLYLDQDFSSQYNQPLRVAPSPATAAPAAAIIAQLTRDAALLAAHGLMDYSLVMTMTPVAPPPPPPPPSAPSPRSDAAATPTRAAPIAIRAPGSDAGGGGGGSGGSTSGSVAASRKALDAAAVALASPPGSLVLSLRRGWGDESSSMLVGGGAGNDELLVLLPPTEPVAASAAVGSELSSRAVVIGATGLSTASSLAPSAGAATLPVGSGSGSGSDGGGGSGSSSSMVHIVKASGGGGGGGGAGGASPAMEAVSPTFRLNLSMLSSPSLAHADALRLAEAAQQFPLRMRAADATGAGIGQWSGLSVQLVQMPTEGGGPPRTFLLQVGMLDILQSYTCSKASERGAKTALRGLRTGSWDAYTRVSSVDPTTYFARFVTLLPRVFIDTDATPGTLVLQPSAWGPARGTSHAGPRYAVVS